MRVIILAFSLVLFVGCSNSKTNTNKKHEKYYQTKICTQMNGIMEYRLFDNTRVDCLTSKYAIEVDWSKKWAEAVGQSLYYANITQKTPAIALIVGKYDKRYLKRLRVLTKKYNIKLFIINKE
jgi:hypothetical protein